MSLYSLLTPVELKAWTRSTDPERVQQHDEGLSSTPREAEAACFQPYASEVIFITRRTNGHRPVGRVWHRPVRINVQRQRPVAPSSELLERHLEVFFSANISASLLDKGVHVSVSASLKTPQYLHIAAQTASPSLITTVPPCCCYSLRLNQSWKRWSRKT